MAEISKLFVTIGSKFDPKGIDKGLGKMNKFKAAATKITKALKVVALAGAAMGAALVVAATKAAKAAGVQEQAEIKLAQAMKSTGEFSQEAFEDNLRYASSLQKVTTVGDETSIEIMQLGLNMGVAADQIQEATKESIALSKAYGVDLKASMKMVALARAGEFSMLARYIPQLRTTTDKTEQLAIFNKAMADGFKIAEAETKTYAGMLQQLSNRWGDIIEKVGFIVIPIFEQLVQVIDTHVLPAMEDWTNTLNEGSGFAEGFGKTLKFVIEAATVLINTVDILADGIVGLGLAMVGRFSAAKEAFTSMGDKFVEFGETVGKLTAAEVERTEIAERAKLESRRRALIEGLDLRKAASEEEVAMVEKEIAAEQNKTEQFLGLTSEINKLGSEVFEEDKARRKALQPLMVAEATANTYLGATKAFAQGGILGIATSAIVIATGLAQVAKISAQKFAKGVRNFAGGLAIVGEEGPELMEVPRGANIYNNTDSRKMMGGTINNYITVNQATNRSLAREQARLIGNEIVKKVGRTRKL